MHCSMTCIRTLCKALSTRAHHFKWSARRRHKVEPQHYRSIQCSACTTPPHAEPYNSPHQHCVQLLCCLYPPAPPAHDYKHCIRLLGSTWLWMCLRQAASCSPQPPSRLCNTGCRRTACPPVLHAPGGTGCNALYCLGPLGLGCACPPRLLFLQLLCNFEKQAAVVLLADLLLTDDPVVVSGQEVEGPPLEALSNPAVAKQQADMQDCHTLAQQFAEDAVSSASR